MFSTEVPRETGFTLIELLVVLTILGLMAAIGTGALRTRPLYIERARVEAALRAAIVVAREDARRTGQVVSVPLSALPTGADLQLVPALPGAAANQLLIYPDGTSNGGEVSQGNRRLFKIDWFNGEKASVAL